MLGVLEGFFIIFTVIGAGYLLARTRIIPNQESRLILNRVAFFVATPALMYTVVSTSDPSALFSAVIGISTLATAVTALITALIAVLYFNADRPTATISAATASYVNSNSIGLPVGMYVLGKADYVAPLLVLQMVVLTPIILALISDPAPGQSRLRGISGAVIQGICSPIVIGAGCGLLVCLQQWETPELIAEPLTLIGGASIPLILMSFGASLYKARPLHDATQRGATLVALGMKTLGMPIIAGLLGWIFGLRGEDLYAVVILASLPAAQNVYNYAATYQKATVVARDTILLSTLLALPAMLIVAGLFSM
ncbi:MAG: AEC family transporter [Corynebacterium sp.]|nr:AEC family transporter [Corynebacterium sp.]